MSNLKAKNYDITSLILVVSLITIGLINIYSVSYSDLSSIENFFSKQVVFVLFSFAICLRTSKMLEGEDIMPYLIIFK